MLYLTVFLICLRNCSLLIKSFKLGGCFFIFFPMLQELLQIAFISMIKHLRVFLYLILCYTTNIQVTGSWWCKEEILNILYWTRRKNLSHFMYFHMLVFLNKDRVVASGVTPRNVIWSHPLLYLLIWLKSLSIFKPLILLGHKEFLKIFLGQHVYQKSNHQFILL